jgi:ABC-2 type transport system ATP-binding protein
VSVADTAIVTRALTKRFGAAVALDGLDLEVNAGEVFGFVGPNGAGKTTTIRLLLDLLRPTSGTVHVLGLDPRRDGVAVRRRIGYLPGDLSLPTRLTGRAFLADHAAVRGLQLGSVADELAERLAADLDRPMGELSLGNRRKVGVIAAFVHRPELLVLDEPTGGLDPLVQQEFRALTREAAADGRTVFLSSHVLDEVQHTADRVAVLRRGRLVVEDRVDALIARLVRTITVTFPTTVLPEQFHDVAGVSTVTTGGPGELTFVLAGAAGPLISAIAPFAPLDLHASEPDLEDAFLGYYQGDGVR